MTHGEWRACTDPDPMLAFLRGKGCERKLRLFAFACYFRVRPLFVQNPGPSPCPTGLEATLETILAGADQFQMVAARAAQIRFNAANDREAVLKAPGGREIEAARASWAAAEAARAAERKAQADLLRCLFGPAPFLPPPEVCPAWLTWEGGTVARIAAVIDDERAFDRLPILADALEEAGCDNPDILSHLRSPGSHTRGCWCLELLLAKK